MIDATHHAAIRLAQRAIHPKAIEATLLWGAEQSAGGGARIFYLGKRECREALFQGAAVDRYEGTTLIVASNGVLITAYRAPRPPRSANAPRTRVNSRVQRPYRGPRRLPMPTANGGEEVVR